MDVEMGGIREPFEAPDEKAVGSWTCGCGTTSWPSVRSTPGCALIAECFYCGDKAEVLPLPLRDGHGDGSGAEQGGFR